MANKRFMTVETAIPGSFQIMRKLGVERDGDVQDKLNDLVANNLRDYMPQESGRLVGSMRKLASDRIRVDTPYARFLFFGVTARGDPVHYENLNPQGAAHWDRRMVAERGAKIITELQRYVRSRRG